MVRHYSFLDHIFLRIDRTLRLVQGINLSDIQQRNNPAANISETELTSKEKKQIAGYMRVNYAGEVCAQALYKGQSLTARRWEVKQKLIQASAEENDHLFWCQTRLQELESHVSYLNPVWGAGALLLGTFAGLWGDQWSLGFLAETEKQVTQHLENHLSKVPAQDNKTRAILNQMREDEMQHAYTAINEGAIELPLPLRFSMRLMSKVMTTVAYWV